MPSGTSCTFTVQSLQARHMLAVDPEEDDDAMRVVELPQLLVPTPQTALDWTRFLGGKHR